MPATSSANIATYVTNSIVVVGAILLAASYFNVFSKERGSYTASRFWIGIPEHTAQTLVPLQILAAIGFILFVLPVSGIVPGNPTKGVLTYWNGYITSIVFATFFASSCAWPYLTRNYLNSKNSGSTRLLDVMLPVLALSVAACSAGVMVAGSFEADMPAYSCIGVVIFAAVVIVADGIGWNAKLISDFMYHNVS